MAARTIRLAVIGGDGGREREHQPGADFAEYVRARDGSAPGLAGKQKADPTA